MKKSMKESLIKTVISIMFTTGAALVILSVYFLITGTKVMESNTILEIFGANIIICFGLLLRFNFEIRNIILEYFIDVSYITAVLVVFSIIFNWLVPVWLLAGMAALIYIFTMIIVVNRIRKDTKEINELLEKRREKEANIAP